MITKPVAVTRGVLGMIVLWALGAAATYAVFRLMGAHTTIQDVPGNTSRVQIVWWGTHAFCACAAALIGTLLTGTALTRSYLCEPGAAAAWGVGTSATVGLVVLVGAAAIASVGSTMVAASAIGLLIGVAGGAAFILSQGARDDRDRGFAAPRRRPGQSWGSR